MIPAGLVMISYERMRSNDKQIIPKQDRDPGASERHPTSDSSQPAADLFTAYSRRFLDMSRVHPYRSRSNCLGDTTRLFSFSGANTTIILPNLKWCDQYASLCIYGQLETLL